jgi:acyl-CoA reductase-like NAD-dependent aldehyde dehydrogenase
MRFSPGDLSIELPTLPAGNVDHALVESQQAYMTWSQTSLDQRIDHLRQARHQLEFHQEELASGIALEVGKPLTESLAELSAVIAKFELSIQDARSYLTEKTFSDAPHPNRVRHRSRGVAVVIGPFNFPIHLAHGAIVAYLLAGNTVIFKPSPFACNVCQTYGDLMAEVLPEGVFQVVQGGAETGQALVNDPRVRSVCFTGSIASGQAIARACANDITKDVALELGGKNASVVLSDADLDQAAGDIAQAICLTTGQRCNSTSRLIVESSVASELIDRLRVRLQHFVPANPLDPQTTLGPLVSESAKIRYLQAISGSQIDWLTPLGAPEQVQGKRGHYVLPALGTIRPEQISELSLWKDEIFAPVCLVVTASDSEDQPIIDLVNSTAFGLTAGVFTKDLDRFERLSRRFDVGNVYMNLPTTFSPSTLPFGGLKNSGNRHPGGRGFIRFTTDEQVTQIRA